MRNRNEIGIGDISPAGEELSDEQLLAVRGGYYAVRPLSTCNVGGEDGDGEWTWYLQ
jgi:hypothetical protein